MFKQLAVGLLLLDDADAGRRWGRAAQEMQSAALNLTCDRVRPRSSTAQRLLGRDAEGVGRRGMAEPRHACTPRRSVAAFFRRSQPTGERGALCDEYKKLAMRRVHSRKWIALNLSATAA